MCIWLTKLLRRKFFFKDVSCVVNGPMPKDFTQLPIGLNVCSKPKFKCFNVKSEYDNSTFFY